MNTKRSQAQPQAQPSGGLPSSSLVPRSAIAGERIDTPFYQAIRPGIRDGLIEGAAQLLEKLPKGDPAENAAEGKEIDHWFRDGFVPFTNGGWRLDHEVTVDALTNSAGSFEEVEGAIPAHVPAALRAGILALRDAAFDSALTALKDSGEDWTSVCAFLEKDPTTYEPADLVEVYNAVYETGEADGGARRAKAETLRERIYDGYENEEEAWLRAQPITFSIAAQFYEADNNYGEIRKGQAEVLILGQVLWGETFWIGARPERSAVRSTLHSLPLAPDMTPDQVKALVADATRKIAAWALGEEAPVA